MVDPYFGVLRALRCPEGDNLSDIGNLKSMGLEKGLSNSRTLDFFLLESCWGPKKKN